MAAESVQYHLERMLPELQDLQERGIFSAPEIRAIVEERTALEYAIHRRVGRAEDFERYIQYESDLDRLRKKRKARLSLDVAPSVVPAGKKSTKQRRGPYEGGVSLSDVAGLRRIHGLYQKMLRKWSGRVDLWVRYLNWCQGVESSRVLGNTFAQAIQLHPTKDVFWIMAAAWEFHTNANILSARTLLQRGLRLNPTSTKLWLEYFKLECLWVEKIRQRREILLGQDPPAAVEVPQLSEETGATCDVEGENIDSEERGFMDPNGNNQQAHPSPEDAYLTYPVPRAIYRNAIRHIPHDLAFRVGFLDMYKEFGPNTAIGQQEVLESLTALIPELISVNESSESSASVSSGAAKIFVEDVVAILCRRELLADVEDEEYPGSLAKCVDDFKRAVTQHPTHRMWDLFIQFLNQQLTLVNLPALKTYLTQSIISVHSNRHNMGTAQEQTYIDWCHALKDSDVGDPLGPLNMGLVAYPASPVLWLALIAENESSADELVVRAFQHVPADAISPILMAYFTAANGKVKVPIQKYMEEHFAAMSEDVILFWAKVSPPARQTAFMKRKIDLGASPTFLRECICMVVEGANPSPLMANQIRGWYERLVSRPSSVSASSDEDGENSIRAIIQDWIAYVEWEMVKVGNMRAAMNLYWKAGKWVDEEQVKRNSGGLKGTFERAYQEMLSRVSGQQ